MYVQCPVALDQQSSSQFGAEFFELAVVLFGEPHIGTVWRPQLIAHLQKNMLELFTNITHIGNDKRTWTILDNFWSSLSVMRSKFIVKNQSLRIRNHVYLEAVIILLFGSVVSNIRKALEQNRPKLAVILTQRQWETVNNGDITITGHLD